MKKVVLTLLAICMVLVVASLPVYAEPPIQVSGDFDYEPTILDEETRGGNWIVDAKDVEWWTGDLEGIATSEYKAFFHRSGVLNFSSKGVFVGSVLGREGTLQYQLTGIRRKNATEFQGTWWMGQGTGELANVHAGGTWWGPGYGPISPMCSYEGQVHFDP